MKKLLDISSEERNRILEMHQTATRKNYLTEAPTETSLGSAKIGNINPNIVPGFYVTNLYAPGEIINISQNLFSPEVANKISTNQDPSRAGGAKILSHTLSLTEYGKKLGIDQSSIVIKKPVGVLYWGKQPGEKLGDVVLKLEGGLVVAPVTVSFKAPQTPFTSTAETAKQPVITIIFDTNDKTQRQQTLNVYFLNGSGVAVGAETTPK